MNNKSLGIYAVKVKKFYYLETGKISVVNTITRLRRTLIQRRVIDFDERYGMNTSDYKVLSCREAKLQEMEMVPIYISPHVMKTVQEEEKNQEEVDNKGIWGDN
jgi:hypothetical protein